mgnify:CR=1 FL=1
MGQNIQYIMMQGEDGQTYLQPVIIEGDEGAQLTQMEQVAPPA